MAPTQFATTLESATECDAQNLAADNSPGYRAFGIIFFLLVFYALALWDRWLTLKVAEREKLNVASQPVQSYGSGVSTSKRTSQQLEVPPFHTNTKVGHSKISSAVVAVHS